MSLHYIIDGSNLLYFSGYVDDCMGDVVMARRELNRAVSAALDDAAAGVRATIVYDVHSWAGPVEDSEGLLKIVYAVGPRESQPADKEILSMIEAMTHGAEELALVTGDSSLRREAMFLGCGAVSCEKFWKDFALGYR